jgi:carbamoyltransferase
MTCDVIPEARDLIPAVVHVDGTARPQVVRREANFRLWSLLRAFQQLTGVPVLINTSFNLAGRPIVSSVEDALVTFSASTMDALVVGGCLLLKSGARVDGDAWRGHAFKRP